MQPRIDFTRRSAPKSERNAGAEMCRSASKVAAIICTLALAACTDKAKRANEYPVGTEIKVIVTELGVPDVEKRYSDALRKVEFCPSETVRLLEYHRRPLPLISIVDHGSVAVICVDSTDRVVKVLFSDS